MPEETTYSNVILKYGVDQAGLDQVKSATDSIQKGFLSLESSAKRLEEAGKKDSVVFQQLAASSELVGRSNTITQVAQQFAVLGKATGDYNSQLANLIHGLGDFGASAAEIRKATTEFNLMRNEIDDDAKSLQALRDTLNETSAAGGKGGAGGEFKTSNFQRAARSFSGLGAQGIAAPLAAADDISDLIEVFGDLRAALPTTAAGMKALTLSVVEVAAPIAPLVVALGGLLLIAKQISDEFAKGKSAVDAALKAQRDKFEAEAKIEIDGKTMTLAAVKDRQQVLLAEADANDKYIASLYRNMQDLQKMAQDNTLARPAINQAFQQVKQAYDDAIKKQGDERDEVQRLTDKIEPLVRKREEEAARIAETITTLQQQADVERQLAQDRKLASTKQIEDLKKQLGEEAEIIEKQMKALAPSTGEGKDDANKEYERLQNQLSAIIQRIQALNSEIAPGVKVTEDLNEALKNAFKTVGDGTKQVEVSSKTSAKFYEDLEKISEDRLQKLAEIEQSYADKRVDIAAKAAQAAQDNLTKLEQHQEDLFINLGRDMQKALADEGYKENDLRIQAARQEVADKQAHLKRLQEIERSFYDSDQQARLDRNFVQLVKNKLAQSSQIDSENSKFKEQENQRVTNLNNQITDERRHLLQARQQRLQAYQEALVDANRQYTREVQARNLATEREYVAARVANERQIRDTNQHYATLDQQRRLAYQHELAQLTQHETKKLQIQTHAQDISISSALAAVAKIQGLGRVGASQEITRRAEGGPLAAFQASLVNEPGSSGRETYTANGRTIGLPGFGVFIPSSPGQVNANKGEGPQIANNFNIYGATDPAATARALEPMVKKVSYDTVKQVVG